jgi:beta-galactosidase
MDVQGTPIGRATLARLVKEVKALDPDRPTIFGGVVAFDDADYYRLTDVVGMHYRAFFGVLDRSVEYVPDRPHILDEEGLHASTRGIYEYDKVNRRAGSLSTLRDVMMDTDQPSANAALLPVDFKITGNVADFLYTAFHHDKVSGVFIWSALDYIGEPTPQRWPATTSSYGGRDLVGLPKDYYWLLRSLLRPEPLVHAFPHWTRPGKEGQKLEYRAFTNCETVEFVVNGTIVGRQPAARGLVVFDGGLEYQPGEILVRGYNGDELAATHRQVTVGKAAKLFVEADRSVIGASGRDIAFIRVAITDDDGNLIPDADNEVNFEVSGAGRLVGAHNADPSTDVYTAVSSARAFNGFIGVYVEGKSDGGEIVFVASSSDLATTKLVISVSKNELEHRVHVSADEALSKLFGVHTQSR